MLSKKTILHLFERLDEELGAVGEVGEIGIVGGTVMCLVYNAREATKDIDAVFSPSKVIRKLARKIAEEEGLPPDWINDGAKAFIQPAFKREEVLSRPHLRVWAPDARYMLAMKCLSARWDTNDREDVIFLIRFLKIKKASSVFKLIEGYYPKAQIPTKTKFFIDELFEGSSDDGRA